MALSKLIRKIGTEAILAGILIATPALAQKHNGPGVTDTEIKIGQPMPYSGPQSAYATVGHAHAAYFEKINAEGGHHRAKNQIDKPR